MSTFSSDWWRASSVTIEAAAVRREGSEMRLACRGEPRVIRAGSAQLPALTVEDETYGSQIGRDADRLERACSAEESSGLLAPKAGSAIVEYSDDTVWLKPGCRSGKLRREGRGKRSTHVRKSRVEGEPATRERLAAQRDNGFGEETDCASEKMPKASVASARTCEERACCIAATNSGSARLPG